MKRSDIRRCLIFLLLGAFTFGVVLVSYEVTQQVGIRSLRGTALHRLNLYGANLQAEMERFKYLPAVISLNKELIEFLRLPDPTQRRDAVNHHLQTVNDLSGASAVYVMDPAGLTLAASNWSQPASFVNMNFAYRPYFQEAAKGRQGRFYGIGTVSREAGYYFAEAILESGSVIGVTAVKVNLERLDQAWSHDGEKIAVVDGNGVVFMTSEPNWKYRTLRRLSPEAMERLTQTRQYSEAGMLSPLSFLESKELDGGALIVRLRSEPVEHRGRLDVEYVIQEKTVPGTDWRLLIFSEIAPARTSARIAAAIAALSTILAALLVLYFHQRRKYLVQMVSARTALQHANDELERKVAQRTEALSMANEQLQEEIAERKRAESRLRSAMEDLVHSARMAVVGKMAAGITHELNQPLAALRTLSGNAIVFLRRRQPAEAQSNLQIITQLVDHMGKITSQLKRFAHKSTAEHRPVDVECVVADALFLLEQGKRLKAVAIDRQFPSCRLTVFGEANRLEQVFVNLLSNALDASAHAPRPQILVTAILQDGMARIEVHDNGAGVPENVLPRLFEPFFSTKEQGAGLGLGLAISADIVRQMGGTLTAGKSRLLEGAVFTVQLRCANCEVLHA